MLYQVIKVLISAVLIVVIAEVSKRFSWLGGLLASLPLISYLAIIWLYVDTGNKGKVSALSMDIFWLVIPSLSFFLMLPVFLKKMDFYPAMGLATVVMFVCYLAGLSLVVLVGK
ncbi:hypothetical protein KS4_24150 [Poriferisphaera corsica]|uniref:DUF3147 family protein n=1 Tax=Poriferisphaera corsica TaxID=2528020 RepID=A0A517YVT6_9BACT|nr:DUF3147 family protein [Poriferisphaera corsica]QDU34347.1 hypothetical protein KS4_24150 [Poriferisphaera corsica]